MMDDWQKLIRENILIYTGSFLKVMRRFYSYFSGWQTSLKIISYKLIKNVFHVSKVSIDI